MNYQCNVSPLLFWGPLQPATFVPPSLKMVKSSAVGIRKSLRCPWHILVISDLVSIKKLLVPLEQFWLQKALHLTDNISSHQRRVQNLPTFRYGRYAVPLAYVSVCVRSSPYSLSLGGNLGSSHFHLLCFSLVCVLHRAASLWSCPVYDGPIGVYTAIRV